MLALLYRANRLRAAGSILAVTTVVIAGLALPRATATHAASQTLLVARDITDLRTLDPDRQYEFTANMVAMNTYDTLITYKGADVQHPVPDLATSWNVSRDVKTFTFRLRHGVRFASGNPMTADDVVFSYRRLQYLNDIPEFLVAGVSDVRALDKYTVRITLAAPDASFLAALTDLNFGVLDSKVVMAHGGVDSKDAATKDKARSFLDSHSVGTGAFQLTNWTRNDQVVLVRNPNFWGPRPALDKIIFQNQTDATTQRLLLQRGSVDVALNIDLQQAQTLMHDSSVKVVTGNTLDLIYIGMTTSVTRSAPLANKLVRQAVRYAIDYDGILQGLLKGVGTRPASAIPVGLVGNDVATNTSLLSKQNLTKARALLKQAGYPNGFSVTMSYPVNWTFDGVLFDPLANKVQNDLARVGIKVNLNPMKFAIMLAAYRGQKLQMALWDWGVDYPDPNDYAGPFSPGGGVAHRVYYGGDSHLVALVNQADSTTDQAKRAALYRTIQQIWLDEGPWAALVQPQDIVAFGSNIKGYIYSPVFPTDFRTLSK